MSKAWHGLARHGEARLGQAGHGEEKARRRHGMAWPGRARRGMAGQGEEKAARRGEARRGKARQGEEKAGQGRARQGMARQGEEKAWKPQLRSNTMRDEPESFPVDVDTWPLDLTRLTKGQDIPPAQCEEITGVKQTQSRYPFALMGLRLWIMTETAKAGNPLSISVRGGGLHVNMDGEASHYHTKLAKDAERSIHRNFGHLCRTVNVSALTEQEKNSHEQSIKVWALKIAALKGARKQIGANEAQTADCRLEQTDKGTT